MLGDYSGKYAWNNKTEFNLEYSIKYSTLTNVYIVLETKLGKRFLKYTPSKLDLGNLVNNRYIHIAVPLNSMDGKWHTFQRDLQKDLQQFQPKNRIIKVNAFMIKGNARVDDIKLSKKEVDKKKKTLSTKQSSPKQPKEVTIKISTKQLLSQID